MIISIDAEKAFHKIQHPLKIKTLSQLEKVGGNLHNLIKTYTTKKQKQKT